MPNLWFQSSSYLSREFKYSVAAEIFLLAQSLPWKNIFLHKQNTAFGLGWYTEYQIRTYLLKYSWCSFWIFISHCLSSFVAFAEDSGIQGTWQLKQVVFSHDLGCLVGSSRNPLAQIICAQCQCLSPGWRQTEDRSLLTCSSGNWIRFLICKILRLFLKVSFLKLYIFSKKFKKP